MMSSSLFLIDANIVSLFFQGAQHVVFQVGPTVPVSNGPVQSAITMPPVVRPKTCEEDTTDLSAGADLGKHTGT
jgi:hypothetical protein